MEVQFVQFMVIVMIVSVWVGVVSTQDRGKASGAGSLPSPWALGIEFRLSEARTLDEMQDKNILEKNYTIE